MKIKSVSLQKFYVMKSQLMTSLRKQTPISKRRPEHSELAKHNIYDR